MKKILSVFLLATIVFSVFPEGNDSVGEFYSPTFLAGGISSISQVSPHADGINPAASARNQRITLDLNYIGFGFDDKISGWKGISLNTGATIPSRVGVFSFSAHFQDSPEYTTMNLGTQFGLNTSFSKELYENYLTGFGLNASFGDGLAVTADLGIIHMTGDWLIFPDFRWGVVLQEFGWVDKSADYPAAFTLQTGIGFTPVETEILRIDTTADLLFPGFRNARMSLGMDFGYKDLLGFRLSTKADLGEIMDGDLSALIPSFGIYFNLMTSISEDKFSSGMVEQGWNRSSINITSAAAPLGNGLWGIGGGINIPLGIVDKNPPLIELDTGGFRFAPIEEEEDSEEGDDVSMNKSGSKPGSIDSLPSHTSQKNGKSDKTPGRVQIVDLEEKGLVKDRVEAESIPVVEYISPNNDGRYDDLDFPIQIKDTRYIQGFALVIQDLDGNIVRRLGNKEERQENEGFSGFFKRLFSVEKGITIPESLRWDGASEEGAIVPDGKYIFYLQAWDDNENQGYSTPMAVMVDNTPPDLEVVSPQNYDLVFSPDGDGNKDTLPIELSGSSEDLWTLTIINSAGTVVRTYLWENDGLESIVWDGKSDSGEVVPDDVYYCEITSTDKGGNTTTGGFENIIINTIPTPISLSIRNSYFAPGREESISNIELTLNIPVRSGILDWNLNINRGGRVMKTFSGGDTPPETIIYNGETDDGTLIQEGAYEARMDIRYINGNEPSAVSPVFNVDTTPPDADVTISYSVFSPNGDDKKDTIKFYQETSSEDEWAGVILDEYGNVVSSYAWIDSPDPILEWDGSSIGGQLAPDGNYTYILSSLDRAGNLGRSERVEFSLDTEETPILISTGSDAFSPNNDDINDLVSIIPELRISEGIDRWNISITDDEDQVIREYSGTGTPDDEIYWDGYTSEGRMAPDGEYKAKIVVSYLKGDVSDAVSRQVLLDTAYPRLEIETEDRLFSPDGDGNQDEVVVVQETSIEALWTGTIVDESGNIVREYFWKENAGTFRWDGKDGEGNQLADGIYTYRLSAEDKAGNRTEGIPEIFTVDASPRVVYVTADSDGFSPNKSGDFEDFLFNVIIPVKDGISSWSLDILNESGRSVKSFSESIIPDRIVWDGTGNNGVTVSDGKYTAMLEVQYLKGNNPDSATSPFLVDTRAPELFINVSPLPFSPDNDGIDDEVSIFPEILDLTGIESWELVISDRTGRTFKSYQGSDSLSPKIIWDGRADNGELVTSAEDYFYTFSSSDKWNNRSEIKGVLPVDVLVIRVGDLLKIQISSIQFAPDSPELSEDSQEIIDRNIYVLRRLAEILEKYERYSITIEGHAALLRWNNPVLAAKEETEELQPLSKLRAETVRNYLIQLGIAENRINTLGRGGTQPVVPHSDTDNRWKNRRVEFILEK